MQTLQPGTRLRDRYRIAELVGTISPVETLYRIDDERFSTVWAMREIDASRVSGDALERAAASFERESAFYEGLRHQGMAQVVDHWLDRDAGRAYVVSEWADGGSLSDRIRKHPQGLPLDQVVDLGSKTLDVLYFFHTGAEHTPYRVLSPSTVWLTSDDEIKLVDFALATSFDPKRAAGNAYRFGQPGYVSPEHAAGGPPDLAMDTFAAGALLHYMATGRDPALHEGEGFPPPSELRKEVTASLSDVIMKALNKDPKQRYHDIGGFKHDLMAVAEEFAPDESPSAGATPSTRTFQAAAPAETKKGCGGAALLVLALLLAPIVIYLANM
ncbi:MAG: serine/threonine protein kinase [Armatimonadetes bacterium]|nr:serine/threonine protein kinase [Armatimonadota bacterium]